VVSRSATRQTSSANPPASPEIQSSSLRKERVALLPDLNPQLRKVITSVRRYTRLAQLMQLAMRLPELRHRLTDKAGDREAEIVLLS
jgi:hypothetical protein